MLQETGQRVIKNQAIKEVMKEEGWHFIIDQLIDIISINRDVLLESKYTYETRKLACEMVIGWLSELLDQAEIPESIKNITKNELQIYKVR